MPANVCGDVGSCTSINGSAALYRDRVMSYALLCLVIISFRPSLSPLSAYITAEQINLLSAKLVLVTPTVLPNAFKS